MPDQTPSTETSSAPQEPTAEQPKLDVSESFKTQEEPANDKNEILLSQNAQSGETLKPDLEEQSKASGAEDRTLDHWSNLFFDELNISLRRSHLSSAISVTLNFLDRLESAFYMEKQHIWKPCLPINLVGI